MIADQPPPIVCEVAHVHDGDGPYWCRGGPKIRVAGVSAPDFEDAPPCRQHRLGYVCDDVLAEASRQKAMRLVLNRTLTCRKVDRSHKRVVARCTLPDGRSLSCALIASGAATRWDSYWRRYRMGVCQ